MASRRYAGDDPHRTLPDYAVVTLSGKPDGELGHIVVEMPRGLTHREHLMLMRRFAAHLQPYADDYEEFWLRRRLRHCGQAGENGGGAAAGCGVDL
jgi:hypothetical protein